MTRCGYSRVGLPRERARDGPNVGHDIRRGWEPMRTTRTILARTRAFAIPILCFSLAASAAAADEPGKLADEAIAANPSLEALRARFVPAFEQLLPASRDARVLDFFATREPAATFRGVPGSARLRPGPDVGVPGVGLAGAWTDTGWPATMEGAVRSGHAAARLALPA